MAQDNQTFWNDSRDNSFELTLNMGNVAEIDRANYEEIFKGLGLGEPAKKFSVMEEPENAVNVLVVSPPMVFAVIYILIQRQLQKFDDQIAAWKKAATGTESAVTQKDREGWYLSGISGEQVDTGREKLIEAIGNFFRDRKTAFSNSLQGYKEEIKVATEEAAAVQKRGLEEYRKAIQERSDLMAQNIRAGINEAIRGGDYSSLSAEASE